MKFPLFVLLGFVVSDVYGQECRADGACDSHERCPVWKEEGECYRNKSYMDEHCPVSCGSINIYDRSPVMDCKDAHPRCGVWADLGECSDNAQMKVYCAKSCNSCAHQLNEEDLCVDTHENCGFWADKGECQKNPGYMLSNCPKSCDSCKKTNSNNSNIKKAERKVESVGWERSAILDASAEFGNKQAADGNEAKKTLELIKETVDYMRGDKVQSLPAQFRDNCKNKHELCSFWAVLGECEANKSFMKINCAPACHSCHMLDISERCPKLENAVPALKPGDLNKMFERIISTAPGNRTLTESERQQLKADAMTEYSVTVHSRPGTEPATEVSAANDKSLLPWVITFENFIAPEECDAMIQLGYDAGYKRSEDVGKAKVDGTVDSTKSEGRTSENAWCSVREGCRNTEIPTRLHNRMSKVMGIPAENSEDLQILKYEVGQFYNTHHDYIPHQKDRQCGPRILTFFIYLSDVDAGGGTDFPDLGITVMPKKGRALLWPSVYDSDPMKSDGRMRHQALPVEAGTKFAANGWIHMYDYMTPQETGCN